MKTMLPRRRRNRADYQEHGPQDDVAKQERANLRKRLQKGLEDIRDADLVAFVKPQLLHLLDDVPLHRFCHLDLASEVASVCSLELQVEVVKLLRKRTELLLLDLQRVARTLKIDRALVCGEIQSGLISAQHENACASNGKTGAQVRTRATKLLPRPLLCFAQHKCDALLDP